MDKAGSREMKNSKSVLAYKTFYGFQKPGLHSKFAGIRLYVVYDLLHPVIINNFLEFHASFPFCSPFHVIFPFTAFAFIFVVNKEF